MSYDSVRMELRRTCLWQAQVWNPASRMEMDKGERRIYMRRKVAVARHNHVRSRDILKMSNPVACVPDQPPVY